MASEKRLRHDRRTVGASSGGHSYDRRLRLLAVESFEDRNMPSSATFLATGGSWQGVYGKDGEAIAAAAPALPSYAAASVSGTAWTWAGSTTDPRALAQPGGGRAAATWYGSQFTADVNLTDGQAHQLALYLLDWDGQGRTEQVQVTDAATGTVLDTRTASGFAGGEYLTYNASGHVRVTFTAEAGPNAVLGGLFLGPVSPTSPPTSPPTATFLGTDGSTAGSWQGVYGKDGEAIAAAAPALPSYAAASVSGTAWTWAGSTTDPRALAQPGGGRAAATWYGSQFTADVNLTDGQAHQLALYLLDWDGQGRTEQVQVTDAATGTVLDTRTASGFAGGGYLVYNLTGHETITVTQKTGTNAVVSGVFFNPV